MLRPSALLLCLLISLGNCTGGLSEPKDDGPQPVPPVEGSVTREGRTLDSLRPPTCGNGRCESGESSTSCAVDCPAVWHPKPGTSWQWQLKGTLDTSLAVAMYDIDLFDQPVSAIAGLKAAGRTVVCYFSAGSLESRRPDAKDFPPSVIGNTMAGWDERWLDIRAEAVRSIMRKRLDLAKSKGCDGVEPDNVDGYTHNTGFPLTAADQVGYNSFLASEAHTRGLSVGLKNDLGQVQQLLAAFDWALNEECLQYKECTKLSPFTNAGKAVFHVEYAPDADAATVCPQTKPLKFSTLIKRLELDAWVDPCP